MSKARDIADLDFNSPDIDGGNIDGATIGATTAAVGSFTNLSVDGSGLGVGGLLISNSTHNHAALSFARSSTATARIHLSEPDALHTGQLNFQTSDASGGSPNLVTAMVIDDHQNATFNGDLIANGHLRLYTTDDQAQQWYIYTHTDDTLRFNYNGSGADALTFDTSENATFAESLTTGGTITSSGSVTGTNLRVNEGSSLAGGVFKEKNITGTGDSNDLSIFAEGITNGGAVHFMTGGSATKRVTIDGAGLVGIGTGVTAPFAPLHIKETGWSSGAPYGTVQLIEGQAVNDNNWSHLVITDADDSDGNGGSISFATGAASALNPFSSIKGYRQGSNYGALDFYTRPSGGTSARRMRISSDGSIGVGIDAPGNNIHILGNSTTPSAGITIQTHDTNNAKAGINLMSRDPSNVNRTVSIDNDAGTLDIVSNKGLRWEEEDLKTSIEWADPHLGGDVRLRYKKFLLAQSSFSNPTVAVITGSRGYNYPQISVYARVRQMGLSVNRATIAEGFVSLEKDNGASNWDVNYQNSSSDFILQFNVGGTSVKPAWVFAESGTNNDDFTLSIMYNRSTNYDKYITEIEVFSHQNISFDFAF